MGLRFWAAPDLRRAGGGLSPHTHSLSLTLFHSSCFPHCLHFSQHVQLSVSQTLLPAFCTFSTGLPSHLLTTMSHLRHTPPRFSHTFPTPPSHLTQAELAEVEAALTAKRHQLDTVATQLVARQRDLDWESE